MAGASAGGLAAQRRRRQCSPGCRPTDSSEGPATSQDIPERQWPGKNGARFQVRFQMKQAALGADAEANREVQDDGQGTQIEQKGAPHCQEVHLPLEEASEENAQHTEVSLAGEDQRPKIAMAPGGALRARGHHRHY